MQEFSKILSKASICFFSKLYPNSTLNRKHILTTMDGISQLQTQIFPALKQSLTKIIEHYNVSLQQYQRN